MSLTRPRRPVSALSILLGLALLFGAASAAAADAAQSPLSRDVIPSDVEATLDGDTITVSWQRPAAFEPGRLTAYWVRLDGALEIYELTRDDEPSVSFPVVDPGSTHTYTVQVAGRSTEPSEPTFLTVPPADDTTPPTPPRWEGGFDDACLTVVWEVVEESTDDTTPQSRIRYEARDIDIIARETHVVDFDLPLSGTGLEELTSRPEDMELRAVDEAGNRSAPVRPDFDWSC